MTYEAIYQFMEHSNIETGTERTWVEYMVECDEPQLTQTEYEHLCRLVREGKIRAGFTTYEMSGQHIGGDDVLDCISQALDIERAGFRVQLWYGPNAEVLVFGVKPETLDGELTLSDKPQRKKEA